MKIPSSVIESFQLLRVPFKLYQEEKEKSVPDIDLVEQDSFYLIRQRIENLRVKIGKTIDEILELQNLEKKYATELSDIEHTTDNLGAPSKIDTLIAALEGKRINRYSTEYDGNFGKETLSGINQYYIQLFNDSWLNKKSFRFLGKNRKVLHTFKKEVSVFDVFGKEDIAKVFSRCVDLVTSPIYDGMMQLEEEYYNLRCGIQMRFKDKSAKFLVPMREFVDIPKLLNPCYMEFFCILPAYAHEKKRYFRKNAELSDFFEYVEKQGIGFSDIQKAYLQQLQNNGKLRLYCERLQHRENELIRGYFLNIQGVTREQQYVFLEKLLHFLNRSEVIYVSRVLPHKNLPEWMKKIGGIIIERRDGEFEKFTNF